MNLSDLTAEILLNLYGAYQMESAPAEQEASRVLIAFELNDERMQQTCQWTKRPNGRLRAQFALQPRDVALCVDVTINPEKNAVPEIEIYVAGEIHSIGHISTPDEWRRFATASLEPLVDQLNEE
jgi:hypothetical protein